MILFSSLSRIEEGRLFRRSWIGYPTRQAAEMAPKLLWDEGHVVRVEQIGARWHVWRSV